MLKHVVTSICIRTRLFVITVDTAALIRRMGDRNYNKSKYESVTCSTPETKCRVDDSPILRIP